MKKTMGLVGLIAAVAIGCSSEDDALSAAQNAGWSDVRVTDTNYFNWTCAEGEVAYHIQGLNAAGNRASAVVCCGNNTMKGCTIRY